MSRAPLFITAAGVGLGVLFTLSSPLEPHPWPNVPPLVALTGPLEPNTLLQGATRLLEGEVLAPESFAIDDSGNLYGGLADGRVVSLDARGENATAVFFSGGYMVHKRANDGVGGGNGLTDAPQLMAQCHRLAQLGLLHKNVDKERTCGRPLGLRWHKRRLYIVDPYHGLFALDPKTGSAQHLFDPAVQPVERPAGADDENNRVLPEVTRRPRFLNDLAILPDGSAIYLTDSSWKNFRAQNRLEIMDAGGRGRLLRLEPASGKVTTVMCGLHFPNGLELDPTEKRLLMVESMRLRVLALDLSDIGKTLHPSLLKGLQTCGRAAAPRGRSANGNGSVNETLPETVKVFTQQTLPGFGDNIRWDKKTGSFLLGIGTKIAQPFSALHWYLRAPLWLRVGIGKVFSMQALEKMVPRYGMVIALGADGEVKMSYHDPSGELPFVSEVFRHPQSHFLFLGSHSNKFLARLRLV